MLLTSSVECLQNDVCASAPLGKRLSGHGQIRRSKSHAFCRLIPEGYTILHKAPISKTSAVPPSYYLGPIAYRPVFATDGTHDAHSEDGLAPHHNG